MGASLTKIIAWHDPDPLNEEKLDFIQVLEQHFNLKRVDQENQLIELLTYYKNQI